MHCNEIAVRMEKVEESRWISRLAFQKVVSEVQRMPVREDGVEKTLIPFVHRWDFERQLQQLVEKRGIWSEDLVEESCACRWWRD